MDNKGFLSEVFDFAGEALLEELCGGTVYMELKKGSQIIREGEKPAYVYYLISGIFRGYYLDDGGEERTDYFAFRRGTPVVENYDLRSPAAVNVEAATDLRCIRISMDLIQSLLAEYPEMIKAYNQHLTEHLYRCLQVKQAVHRYDAEGKYLWFLREYPGLIDMVAHKDIASLLNMTPVTLSRIRRKLRGGGYSIRQKEISLL